MGENENKTLYLLDAMALIYRAYYAFIRRPLYNSKGMNTSAIVGFTNTLYDLLQNEDPTHIAVAFDSLEPTERHVVYEDYKAQREEIPEDIAQSLPYIKSIIRAFNIPVLEEPGYEADDIIGTLAKQAEKKSYVTYMVTSDKDLGQLVSDKVLMYKPGRGKKKTKIYDKKEVLSKWGIERPEQLIDILGLQGDSSDNIPGVPGIGKKRAQRFIEQYGSVEGVLENVEEIKGKLQQKIKNNAEQARLSKELATIICDVPISFNEEELKRDEPDKNKLNELFTDLEFKNLGKRVLGQSFTIASSKKGQQELFQSNGEENGKKGKYDQGDNLETTSHEYHLVNSAAEREELVKTLTQQTTICFDTETSSLNPQETDLVGIAFSYRPQEAYYVPVYNQEEDVSTILESLEPVFNDQNIEKVGQNLKFDLLVLRCQGLKVKGPFYDTMIAHYLVKPDMKHDLGTLAETYLDYVMVPIEKLIGKKGKDQGSMIDVPLEEIKEYAGEDTDITLQLKNKLDKMLKEKEVEQLYWELEAPLIPVLTEMEYEGVAINKQALNDFSEKLQQSIQKIQKRVHEIAGEKFNLASPKQLGEVLFDKLELQEDPKKTPSGQYATNEEVLKELSEENEIAQLVLRHRQLVKLKSTYVDALPRLVNPKTHRIHTTFNQTTAATGRLSSKNPNLQNIPIRTEKGRTVRKAFVPRNENYKLLSADYSQIELRIIADLAKDKNMLKDFKEGLDIHSTTASRVFDVELEEVDRDMRSQAKTVNFGIIYGISPYGLSQRLNIKRKKAKRLIDQYFKKYPDIKKYMDESIERAREMKYVSTIMGRKRYLPDINSSNATVRGYAERNAINAPIQGSAADIIKKAMIDIFDLLQEGYNTKMTLQVHDELIFDTHQSEIEELQPQIVKKMENAVPLEVPIEVETGVGDNWLEAH